MTLMTGFVVQGHIFLKTDSGKPMMLVLLGLSAAFDLVDHNILLSCLEVFFKTSWYGFTVVSFLFVK